MSRTLQNKLKSPAPARSPAPNDDNGMSEGESCSDSDEESDEEDAASSKQPQWTRKENLKSSLLTQNQRQIPAIFGNVKNPDDGVMKGKILRGCRVCSFQELLFGFFLVFCRAYHNHSPSILFIHFSPAAIFGKKAKVRKRGSSAHWATPPMKSGR